MRIERARKDCNECDGILTVVLVVNNHGIWSKCDKCGFTEWEWSWGDNPSYISYLAQAYNVGEEVIMRALEEVRSLGTID
jgi:ribosomal protein S27AE